MIIEFSFLKYDLSYLIFFLKFILDIPLFT